MTAADAEAPTLANRLQASVGQSGLFYESHLQSWYRGEMSGARLAQEPQMRLSWAPEPWLPPPAPRAAPRPRPPRRRRPGPRNRDAGRRAAGHGAGDRRRPPGHRR